MMTTLPNKHYSRHPLEKRYGRKNVEVGLEVLWEKDGSNNSTSHKIELVDTSGLCPLLHALGATRHKS